MKTHLEWQSGMPTEPGNYYAAINHVGGNGKSLGRTVEPVVWEGVWKTSLFKNKLPDNWIVYAWAHPYTLVPQIETAETK